MRKIFVKVAPHAIAVFLLFCISAVFYSPSVIKGERIKQGDIQNFKGMSHETFSYESVEGVKPYWTNSMFSGMPTIQITGTGSTTVPKIIWLILRFFMSPEVMTLFMAMLAGYVLALCLKAPPWVAFIIGATYGLSTINALYLAAGHATKVRAIAVMPGVLGGLISAFRGQRAAGVGIFTLFLALHLYANHLQMTYYLIFLIVAVGVSELVWSVIKGQTKYVVMTSLLLIIGAFCAALPQSADLYITQEYSHYTTRGEAILSDPISTNDMLVGDGLSKDYILEYSMARGEWLSVFVPNIKGGSDPLYWGEQRFSGGAFYFGAIAFALFLAFIFVGKDRIRWPLLFITVLSIILSWRDTSFISDFFINHFPLFNKFRDTKMMLVLVQVAVATGATLAIKEIWEETNTKNWKPWIYSFSGILVVLGLFYIVPSTFFDFTSSIRNDQAVLQLGKSNAIDLRIDIFKSDILRSMGLIVVFIGLAMLTVKKIINRHFTIVLLSVVMIAEIISVNSRYPKNWVSSFEADYPFDPTPPDLAILSFESDDLNGFDNLRKSYIKIEEEKLGHKLSRRHSRAEMAASFSALNSLTHFRVFDWQNPFNDARTSYFHKSIGGYHGAKLHRYQDFIDRVLNPEREAFVALAEASGIGLATTSLKALKMLNTKYIILPGAEQPLPLSGALGAAWFTDSIHWVDDAESEISAIRNVDLASTAIIHKEFESEIASISIPDANEPSSKVANVSLTHYHPDGSTYEVNCETDGVLVFSEVWYPEGWKAKVDGKEVPLIRANYILRALPIKSGVHTVELSFEPSGRKLAGLTSGIGSIVLLLFLISMTYLAYRKSVE